MPGGTGATGRAAADSITLGWDPSSAQVGYKVHVGAQPGWSTQHFDAGSGTLFTFASANAGQRSCFAVSAYLLSSGLEGPNSSEVCGYSNTPPTLVNPGDRTSAVGQAVTLQLQGSDPNSQPLTYSATGLPPGLTVMASTGFISGAGTTAGTYSGDGSRLRWHVDDVADVHVGDDRRAYNGHTDRRARLILENGRAHLDECVLVDRGCLSEQREDQEHAQRRVDQRYGAEPREVQLWILRARLDHRVLECLERRHPVTVC